MKIAQEIGTGEIGWAPSTSKIDLLIAAGFAFADLPIECDCHLASSAEYRAGSKRSEFGSQLVVTYLNSRNYKVWRCAQSGANLSPPKSLLTEKNTGNLRILSPQKRTSAL
jgi:hypothetical protein